MEKVQIILSAQTQEILGDKFVSGLKYNDKVLPVQGVFIEIGSVPNTEFLGGLVNLNERGEIIVDHKNADGKEMFWIRSYMSNKNKYPEQNGLNLTDGGEGRINAKMSEDQWKEFLYYVNKFEFHAFGQRVGYMLSLLKKETKLDVPDFILIYMKSKIRYSVSLGKINGVDIKEWKIEDCIGKEKLLSWWYHG